MTGTIVTTMTVLMIGILMTSHNGNGFTQKEMLTLILEGQQDINKRIDELHEKVNQKLSRQELTGWLVAISALVVLINSVI